jgi:hypothetical protein
LHATTGARSRNDDGIDARNRRGLARRALEPSGEDLLSPALAEADLMRRFLPAQEFTSWLARFLPGIPLDAAAKWPPSVKSTTRRTARVHLHGLNLSRACCLRNVAAALPATDARRAALEAAAERHAETGLRATLPGHHYAGAHWLPTFAVYLLTDRPWRAEGGAP